MQPPDEDVLERLRALPERGPPAATSARIHRVARARFVQVAAAARALTAFDRRLAWLARGYGRIELPLAAGVTVVYLGWALTAALAVFGRR